jgi:hypothetical protein
MLDENVFDREASRIHDVAKWGASYLVVEDIVFAHRGPSKYSQVVGQLLRGQVVSGQVKGGWLHLDHESASEKLRGTWGPALEEMAKRTNLDIDAGSAWIFAESLHFLHPAPCQPPKVMSADSTCICPVPQVPDMSGSCRFPEAPPLVTFYMYQAAGDGDGDLQNINLGNLAAVMEYLHKEVVTHCPRLGGINRILRVKVTMKTTWEVYRTGRPSGRPQLFAPYASMRDCQCTVSNCITIWQTYGYAPGCQKMAEDANYAYAGATWYSLPGECPAQRCAAKSPECRIEEPGGRCAAPNGTRSCTWHVEPAGQVRLEALSGIKDYAEFCAAGKKEFVEGLDQGVGASFWDARGSRQHCEARLEAVSRLFAQQYPGMPKQPLAPDC